MRVRDTPPPAGPRPYRVSRWGKFWSLEPLFAEGRPALIAKGAYRPQPDDVVLAVPARGNRLTVLESLGSCESLAAVLRALVYAQGVRQGFGDEVTEEAAAVTRRGARRDHDRRDLTALATFTIDPDTARDFDDAISVAREGDGYRAHVHIADVSYFVDADGAMDEEARRRTASLYLPLWAEPMLPEALSADVCSLRPGRERKCVTVEFTFAADGTRSSVQFYRSLIRSDHRLTYGLVDEVLAAADPQGDELAARLLLAWELAGVLRRRRFARGALQIGSFEPEYRFDAAGELIGAEARPESPSHSLVEEFMLAANEAVAGYLASAGRARSTACTSRPTRRAWRSCWPSSRSWACRRRLSQAARRRTPSSSGRRCAVPARRWPAPARPKGAAVWPSRSLCCARSSRPSTARATSATSGSPAPAICTSRRRSAATRTWSCTGRCSSTWARAARSWARRSWPTWRRCCSQQERALDEVERAADDVALAFLLEGTLRERGWESVFGGEIVGLVPRRRLRALRRLLRRLPAGARSGRRTVRAQPAGHGAGG